MRLPPLGLSRQKKNVQQSRTTADGWTMTPLGTRGVLMAPSGSTWLMLRRQRIRGPMAIMLGDWPR
jgi:hypothetical protein